MDSRNGVTTCKTSGRRLLGKVFESKPIKRGDKILFEQHKKSLEFYANLKQYVFPEQQLCYSPYLSQPIRFQENQ